MRRYVYCGDVHSLDQQSYDVIVIGSGIAGLYTALNLDQTLSCAILSKAEVAKSNSWLAQGGIAAVISKDDRIESHFQDTMNAGAGLCDEQAVNVLVNEGPQDIRQLMGMNVPFDLDEEGDLHITREGGHTKNRILHCGGDATGRETVKTLASIVSERQNIDIIENVFLTDILTSSGKAEGVIIKDTETYKVLVSSNIVVCTGGIGQVYKHTTNPAEATGDGIAAAIRAGALTNNMEFVQFHPTALYTSDESGQSFLVSEAVRGEGGVLRNIHGECFMEGKHPMKDLAPRDIVTRIIAREMYDTYSKHVLLDITSRSEEFLSKRFPTIFSECQKHGLNMSKDWIPVCPVQHYLMGGLETDLNGMTNIKGLYASGEAACTGVHGANRLASNSLLECLVFGRRCAEDINKNYHQNFSCDFKFAPLDCKDRQLDYEKIRNDIKRIMIQKGGIIRSKQAMEEALTEIDAILGELNDIDLNSRVSIEVLNMAMISKEILKAAIKRKENVGAHYRLDCE